METKVQKRKTQDFLNTKLIQDTLLIHYSVFSFTKNVVCLILKHRDLLA